jgi:heat shock protein HslJ
MPKALVLIGFALFAVLGACASRGGGATSPLERTYWRVVEIGGQPAAGSGGPREPHLQFEADGRRVVGSTGCNGLTGQFTHDGPTLRFGPTATTRMACVDPSVNEQEQRFLAALRDTERHQISGDTLTLLGPGGTLARLVAASRPE